MGYDGTQMAMKLVAQQQQARRHARRAFACLLAVSTALPACHVPSAKRAASIEPATTAIGNPLRPSAAPSGSASPTAPWPQAPVNPSPGAATPTLLITAPEVLAALEVDGLSSKQLLELAGSTAHLPPTMLALITQDIQSIQRSDPAAGVSVARFSHRLFDLRFLTSAAARFELIAVVNRLDRESLVADSCGETRLVYRLAYAADAEHASRLPFTLGIEVPIPRPADGCKAVAARWLEPQHRDAQSRAQWLRREGPLSASALGASLKRARIVVNVQVVRWPSAVRPDLGGHAEYVLRAFARDAHGQLQLQLLENTIDWARLRTQPARRQALLEWLQAHANEIDLGTVQVPGEFLAQRAVSVAPHGLTRDQNRPFSALFSPPKPDTGNAAALDATALDATPGLTATRLRRLDELSCQGCHQARSVAGFHLLGEERPGTLPENALEVPFSPHLADDLPRRSQFTQQWLEGKAPPRQAPFAERPNPDRGPLGAHCDLGLDPAYAQWRCDSGLHCMPLDSVAGDPVGRCVSDTPAAGDACEVGTARPALDSHRDHLAPSVSLPCRKLAACNSSRVGFPNGMCTEPCGSEGSVCGSIAILEPFNACLGRGGSFAECLRNNVRPAGLRPCDANEPCRDDYVCAHSPEGGACIPPYFLFQLRVDGHTLP